MEIEGETLNIFGDALESLDRAWVQPIQTINFQFVLFDMIAAYLPLVRSRFPALHTLTLKDTYVHSLHQINQLAVLKKLEVRWV